MNLVPHSPSGDPVLWLDSGKGDGTANPVSNSNPVPVTGPINITVGLVQLQPSASGGLTPWFTLDLQPAGQVVKATPGQLYGYAITNRHATAWRYVKLYNDAAAPDETVPPLMVIAVPPVTTLNLAVETGIVFSAGISARGTTGVANSDTGAPTVNDLVVNLLYH